MSSEVLLGLDLGTTRCKAVAISPKGEFLASASAEYPILSPKPGWAEQDAEQVWNAALRVLKGVCEAIRGRRPLALGLSVQGEAVIPLGDKGEPLRKAILGMDSRTGPENEVLISEFGGERLFTLTGMPVHTVNTLPKLLWIKRHQPKIWQKTRRFVLYEDFLSLRLSGKARISHCLASRTQLYALGRANWSSEILKFLGLEEDRLSPLGASGELVAPVRKELCRELRIKGQPGVVLGGHDQACAALGAGLVEAGMGMVSTGTAEVVLVVTERPVLNSKMVQGNVSCYRHVVPSRFLIMTLNHCGGIVLQWIRDNFGGEEVQEALRRGVDPYEVLLEGLPEGPTGILAVPHLSGSGSPAPEPAAKGAILGLTLGTTKKHFVKALIEGLCYELRLNLDFLTALGVPVGEVLRTVGGGAKSPLWTQLKADITGRTMEVPSFLDAAPLGAALLAGVAVGIFPFAASAAAAAVKVERRFSPNRQFGADYQTMYNIYRKVRPLAVEVTRALPVGLHRPV